MKVSKYALILLCLVSFISISYGSAEIVSNRNTRTSTKRYSAKPVHQLGRKEDIGLENPGGGISRKHHNKISKFVPLKQDAYTKKIIDQNLLRRDGRKKRDTGNRGQINQRNQRKPADHTGRKMRGVSQESHLEKNYITENDIVRKPSDLFDWKNIKEKKKDKKKAKKAKKKDKKKKKKENETK
mmetsp:Transcript_6923/g.7180  ORF Transcript_6923/g.7180 Transcript_6923/m.7180 type:complete len:184 (-) Transcript_6923:76-627(-)